MANWRLPALSPLAKSKWIATSLLVGAFILFVVAKLQDTGAVSWGYVIAFAEAAMVGAVADWFAVTALFRRPLGLPIPHTAIIPRNKPRIASRLGDFICEHFLSTPQVMQKIKQMQLPRQTMRWLAKKQNAKLMAGYTTLVAQHSLTALRDVRAQQFIQDTAIHNLKKINFAQLGGQVLQLLTHDQRHQELLNQVLKKISQIVETPETQALLTEKIAAELKRTVHIKKISEYLGGWTTTKIVDLIAKEITEIADDPNHELRYSFHAYVQSMIYRLQTDPSFKQKTADIQQQMLQNPEVQNYLHGLWADIIDWLEQDLQAQDSVLQEKLAVGLRQVAQHIMTDPAMQQLLDEKIAQIAPPLIEKYRVRIARYIEERVNAWEDRELVYQLEHAIGKDLQFIRVNGTLVGGAIGVLIHFIGRWL